MNCYSPKCREKLPEGCNCRKLQHGAIQGPGPQQIMEKMYPVRTADTVYMTSARPKEGPGKTETHQYMAAQSRHWKRRAVFLQQFRETIKKRTFPPEMSALLPAV